jgi:hypothetical protein
MSRAAEESRECGCWPKETTYCPLHAAAPELLEALVSVASHVEAVAILPDQLSITAVSVINEARAAIAKAKGEHHV